MKESKKQGDGRAAPDGLKDRQQAEREQNRVKESEKQADEWAAPDVLKDRQQTERKRKNS